MIFLSLSFYLVLILPTTDSFNDSILFNQMQ